MTSVDDLIGLWPSMAELGRDLGLPYSTVAAWKQRGSIPVAYWRALVSAAGQRGYRGVSADLLIEAHGKAADTALQGGFSEDTAPIVGEPQTPAGGRGEGQFSRWKPLRRTHFIATEELADHVRALRSEWDRR